MDRLFFKTTDSFNELFNIFNDFEENRYDEIRYNTYKDDNCNYIELALAGYKKEMVKIDVDGNYLIISGEKKSDDAIKYHEKNIFDKKFEKKFKLSELMDKEKIFAEMEDGILKITIPYTPEKKPLKIKIK